MRYHRPATVDEAIAVLHDYDGQARVVGGGTDLLVETRRGVRRPFAAVVDASHITGLADIALEDGYIVIGCGVTHTQIVDNTEIRRFGTCLAESCAVIGGPQVRNVGTLAGNVAHALPAGDGTIGLLALGGEVEVASRDGLRWMPVRDTFKGPGRSNIDRSREVLTRLRFRPEGPGEGSAYHRVMRPQGLCLPIISMAARLRLADDGTIAAAGISMGPVGPVPWYAEPVASALAGQMPGNTAFGSAAAIALQHVELRASKYRATREYRADMIRTFLPIILERAVRRAEAAR